MSDPHGHKAWAEFDRLAMTDIDQAALDVTYREIGELVMEGLLRYGRIEFYRTLIKERVEVRRSTAYHCYKSLFLEEKTPQALAVGLRELLGGGGA